MPLSRDFFGEVEAFDEVLRMGGLVAGLDFLNQRTAYRFTFVYSSEPPFARKILVYDREYLYISSRDLVPVSQTFFEFMLTEPEFATADGSLDERSCQHPARMHFRGFCGVQLRRADGQFYGWLAHASPGALAVPVHEAGFLHLVAVPLMQVPETMARP